MLCGIGVVVEHGYGGRLATGLVIPQIDCVQLAVGSQIGLQGGSFCAGHASPLLRDIGQLDGLPLGRAMASLAGLMPVKLSNSAHG